MTESEKHTPLPTEMVCQTCRHAYHNRWNLQCDSREDADYVIAWGSCNKRKQRVCGTHTCVLWEVAGWPDPEDPQPLGIGVLDATVK